MKEDWINRFYSSLDDYSLPNKALIIFGPRQAGKTTLLNNYLTTSSFKYKLDSGDNHLTQQTLQLANFDHLKEYAAGYDLIAIDEAQKIPNIGETLKILIDQVPGIRIIATGSSSFELAGQVGEPLTGRKKTLILYPVAQLELATQHNRHELKSLLETSLIYGSYPEVITGKTLEAKREAIIEITQSYLLKDILELNKLKSPKALVDLLRLLAFQVGGEVSHSELAQQVKLDTKTVGRYLDLLEKSFVLYNLRGFSRNLRSEVTKKSKYYFYDNGIRNALIANFNTLDMRNDIGQLWENFLVIERLKKQAYHKIFSNNYFWRTWEHQEIDFIEEHEGKLFGYEFKWGKKQVKAPKLWLETYNNASFKIINQDNYLDFIL